jgi:hypothetical protein
VELQTTAAQAAARECSLVNAGTTARERFAAELATAEEVQVKTEQLACGRCQIIFRGNASGGVVANLRWCG